MGLVPKEWVRATRRAGCLALGINDRHDPSCTSPTYLHGQKSTHMVWHVSTPLTSHTSLASCLNTNRRRCGVTRLHNQHDICTRQELLLTGSLFFTRVITCSDGQNDSSGSARTVFCQRCQMGYRSHRVVGMLNNIPATP